MNCLFNRVTVFAGAFLNAAEQFVFRALDVSQIIIRELGPFLLELAFGDVPVSFNFKFIHIGNFDAVLVGDYGVICAVKGGNINMGS